MSEKIDAGAERDDGGAAFPTEPNTQAGLYRHHGMSLRDWFAGQALASLLAIDNAEGTIVWAAVAQDAYSMADAMIAERRQ